MTYSELYSQATTWTARHVAQDLVQMYGRETLASELDIQEVGEWQKKESGPAILDPAWCYVCDRPKNDCGCVENGGSY